MDDQTNTSEPVAETPVQAPESALAPVELESSQSNGSTPSDLPSEALESPTNVLTPIPVEDQNGGVNMAESDIPQPAPTPQTPQAPQPLSSAQSDQTGFIRALLVKAQAKIQFNKQKKLEKIILLAQKKKIITNDDVQKLLYVSDATTTRYLVKLVQEGRLARAGNPRDAKYQFVR
jgi:hypothetical protein